MRHDDRIPDEELEQELQLRVDRLRFLSSELLTLRRDAEAGRREVAALESELRQLRGRRSVRAALRLSAGAHRVRSLVPGRSRGRTPPVADPGVGRGPGATLGGAADPVAFRSFVRAALRRDAAGGSLRVRLLWPAGGGHPGLPARADLAAALGTLGWTVTSNGHGDGGIDAVLSVDPTADVRAMPDGALRLAWIADEAQAGAWIESPGFDDFDLVFAPSGVRDVVAARSVHLPVATDTADPRSVAGIVRDALETWLDVPHVDIAIGPSGWEAAAFWGDTHFGRSLQRALIRRGVAARLRLRDAWDAPAAGCADAVVHLFGLRQRTLRPSQVNVLWVISHPDLVTDGMLAEHDLVFAASDRLAAALEDRSGRRVVPLHQATDPDRFHPTPGGPAHDLLFVAGYRSGRRPVVDELTPTAMDLAVYGRLWTPDALDPRHLAGEYVPNDRLAAYYSAAAVVLNDHWADMAAWGVFSNRLYDAAAAGAFVLSDHVDGIEQEFDGGIATYRSGEELRRLARHYLSAPDERAAMAARARAAVLARHTFEHRAEVLLEAVGPLVQERRAVVATDG